MSDRHLSGALLLADIDEAMMKMSAGQLLEVCTSLVEFRHTLVAVFILYLV